MRRVRTVIADDESLARRALRRCLESYPEIEIVGEGGSGREVVEAVRAARPDLLFLDIEMPDMNGLQVVEHLRSGRLPVIVFVTAHDRYAIDAFQAHALDFILKPLNECRIGEVMDRVLEQIRYRRLDAFDERMQAVLSELEREKKGNGNGHGGNGVSSATYMQKLAMKENGRIRLLEVSTIDWIEACGNYVTVHAGSNKHLIRETMNVMEARLEPETFLRIHRSIIVNTRSVSEFRPFFNGSYMVMLKDQTRLFSSRGYHPKLEQYISALR